MFFSSRRPAVAIVSLSGTILAGSRGARGLNLDRLEPVLKAAFTLRGGAAVVLDINSPGGSPVQSHLIHDRIRTLSARHKRPVISVVSEIAASGGYILALAGDEIIAHPDSLVGSIGVISGSFGFTEAIRRLGIERRVYTAGENKAFLDPFLPENADNIGRLRGIQRGVYDRFTALVEARRGDRLKPDPAIPLFGGNIFSGQEAVANGLVDRVGSVLEVIEARYGEKVRIRRFASARPKLLGRLLGARIAPTSLFDADHLLMGLEERAAWARYDL